jgi:hypothetical protein
MSAEYAPGAQLGNVREVDAGQGVHQVGLGGADGVRGLRTGAKSAACCHAVIVRAVLPLAARLGSGVEEHPCQIVR